MKIKTLIVIALVSLMLSCEHQQELCFDHDGLSVVQVEVVFDWSDCPDAEPDAMCLYLFSEGAATPRRFDFKDSKGGTISVGAGRFTAIALNSGIENTALRYSSDAESFELWLRGSFSAYSAGLSNPSDMVWLGVEEDATASGDTLRLLMREAVCRCDVDVRHISNYKNLHSATARLSGFNEAVSAIGRIGASGSVSIGFDLERDTETSLHAEIFTLGHCGRARSRDALQPTDPLHLISIGFTLRNGSTWTYTEDVSEQIHNQPDEHCHIVLDSITLPNAGNHGGGLNVDVDEWDTIEFIIKP